MEYQERVPRESIKKGVSRDNIKRETKSIKRVSKEILKREYQ